MKTEIPDKLFFKIGEVADITELEPYVLRYWEGEFGIKLTKSKNNQRLYQRKDIEQILKIKTLLYDEKFTIAGAKRKLKERRKDSASAQLALQLPSGDVDTRKLKEALMEIRSELKSFLQILDQPSSP